MTKEAFQERLKNLNINKQEFSEISNVPYSTVTNWGVMRDGKPMVVPVWVEPFLDYYENSIQRKDYDERIDKAAKLKLEEIFRKAVIE